MKKKFLLFSYIFFVSGMVLSAQENTNDVKKRLPEPIDSVLEPPLLPQGYLPDPNNMKQKMRNFFMSKRFKRVTFQRDSLYYGLGKLEKQYDDLVRTYTEDTTDRTKKYVWLQNNYQSLSADYDSCQNKNKAQKREYLALAQDYRQYRTSSLSEKSKLEMSLAENERELARREARVKDLERTLSKQDSLNNALRDAVKNALLGFDENALSVTLKNGRVYVSFSEKFLFESGKADVNNPEALEALKTLSAIINQNSKLDILIEGHTDSMPIKTQKYADNWDLSAARAIAIVRILSDEYDVDPKRLTAAGRSQYNPKAGNATPEGRAQNRRTEIILIPNLEELYNAFR